MFKKTGTYLLLGIIVPLAFLFLIEVLLRVCGYGYDPDFFIKRSIKGKEYYVNNYKFSWRFFPKSLARLSASVVVPVEKDPKALRIFIVGESAAMGDPEPSFSFSRQLQAMLELRHPDRKIEIYNTAVTAINSNVIVPIVKSILGLKPDLLVVYMGNNEVIGPFGLSSALTPFFSSLNMIKLQIWISQTRIGQFAHNISKHEEGVSAEWKGMEMFTKNSVRANSPDLQTIYNHFEKNLEEIAELSTKAKVPLLLSTVVSNEKDSAPFLSLHGVAVGEPALNLWKPLFDRAQILENNNDFQSALSLYKKANAIDPAFAEGLYRAGICQLALHDSASAAASFIVAKDQDALRFRADTRINNIIRSIGHKTDRGEINLCDTEQEFRKRSRFGIPGAEFLYEHVHLNYEGNQLVAEIILPYIEEATHLQAVASAERITRKKIDKRLAFTINDAHRIAEINLSRISVPPFSAQSSNSAAVRELKGQIAQIGKTMDVADFDTVRNVYVGSLAGHPEDWFIHLNYLRFLVEYEEYPDAAIEGFLLYGLLPYEYISLVNMGITQRLLKHYAESEGYFQQAIDINPYFAEAFKDISVLYADQFRYASAERALISGRATDLELAQLFNNAGLSFARLSKFDSAIIYFKKSSDKRPDWKEPSEHLQQAILAKKRTASGGAGREFAQYYNRGNSLLNKQDYQGAIEMYRNALRLNDAYVNAHNNLAIALIQMGKNKEAKIQFQRSLQLDSTLVDTYINYGQLLESQSDFSEALRIYNVALRFKKTHLLYERLALVYKKIGNESAASVASSNAAALANPR